MRNTESEPAMGTSRTAHTLSLACVLIPCSDSGSLFPVFLVLTGAVNVDQRVPLARLWRPTS
jgi:hypothetical protein